ncbi:MAG: ABC transporter permease, partial [Alistipes sp.]|nr:ABC transporter permease [Candidatus Minthomonas equi]
MNLNLYIGKKIGGNSRIATVSVTLSLCAILISIAVSEGFKREIGEKAVAFSGEIMLSVPGEEISSYEYSLDENLSFLPEIASLKEVRSINGVAYTPGMIKTDDALSGALFKGVTSEYDLSFFSTYMKDGKLPEFNTENPSDEILISGRLASALGFTTGDRITSYFVDENNVRARKFTISGIYDIQLEDIDERLVICDRRHTQRLNGWGPSEVSCVEISLGGDGSGLSHSRRERTIAKIDDIFLNSDSEQDSSVTVVSIDQIYSSLFDWLGLLNMNVLIILILMTAVAGFNMISGLLIILFRNISAIGLFKSLGMRTSVVCRIFLWKA